MLLSISRSALFYAKIFAPQATEGWLGILGTNEILAGKRVFGLEIIFVKVSSVLDDSKVLA